MSNHGKLIVLLLSSMYKGWMLQSNPNALVSNTFSCSVSELAVCYDTLLPLGVGPP